MIKPEVYALPENGLYCRNCCATRYVSLKKTFNPRNYMGSDFSCYECGTTLQDHANCGVPTEREQIRKELLKLELHEAEKRVEYLKQQLEEML